MEFERNVNYIPNDQQGEVVYFIYDITNKLTKIGITVNNVKWRFKEIKMYNPNITLLFSEMLDLIEQKLSKQERF